MYAPLPRDSPGSRVRAARLTLGWTHDDLAGEIGRVRQRRGLPPRPLDSIRRHVIAIQQSYKHAGPLWRSLLAEALDLTEEALFGFVADTELPRPMLIEAVVTPEVIDTILSRRLVHARAEHLFGPRHAQELVAADLSTIAQLVQVTGRELRRDARRAAALVAELGGWIAQDSGDPETALSLTREADAYARNADPFVRAMIFMRHANIVTRRDPALAADLAADAADLITGLTAGRLPAAITRQQAIAALAMGDHNAFREHAGYAAELAQAEPLDDDLASYATPAYVASEVVPGLIMTGQADQAVQLLTPHLDHWPAVQQRDHAVAALRLLRALCAVGDYHAAIDHCDEALRSWRVAPSNRALTELRLIRKLLSDRARSDRRLPLVQLRRRINDALLTDSDHG